MSSAATCRECGMTIAISSPAGLCPKCLFALGLTQGQEQGDESDTLDSRDVNLGEQAEPSTSSAPIAKDPGAKPS